MSVINHFLKLLKIFVSDSQKMPYEVHVHLGVVTILQELGSVKPILHQKPHS